MKNKALVILSGGQDSTTCLFWACEAFEEVHAVTYNYGQRHVREIEAARKVFNMAQEAYGQDRVVSHSVVDVGPILEGSSPLVNSDTALEQYHGMYSLPGGLEKTFVPGRNLLFLTLAANKAYNLGALNIVTGVCQEDFGGYPDCRQIFIDAAALAIRLGFGYNNDDPFSRAKIITPLMDLTKAETVELADELGSTCWEALAYTHTSYDGAYPPTGQDHATLLRAKGFFEADRPDPLVLRAWREGLMELPETTNYADVQLELGGV